MKQQSILNIPITTFFSLWVITIMSSFITEDNNITLAILSSLTASLTVLVPIYLLDHIYYNATLDISLRMKSIIQSTISALISLTLIIHSTIIIASSNPDQIPTYIISTNMFIIFILGGAVILASQYFKIKHDLDNSY